MMGDWEFDVLDYPKESLRTDYKDYFRVYAAPGVLKALGLEKGDPCNLNFSGHSVGTVIVWELNKNSKPKELHIPKHLQSLYGVSHRAKVSLSKIRYRLTSAIYVTLHEVASSESKVPLPMLRDDEFVHWAWLLEDNLYRAETISPGMVIEGIEAKHQRRSFKIIRVNDSSRLITHRFQQSCKVEVISSEALNEINAAILNDRNLTIPKDGVGGLEVQLKELNAEIGSFGNVDNSMLMPSSVPEWTNGIILYGPSGTGKTLVLRKIREAGWRSVFDLGAELFRTHTTGGKALVTMHEMFADAKICQPSVLLIDELEIFASDAPHLTAQNTAFIEALRQEVESLGSFRTLVVATTRSLAKISPKLRSVHGFSLEIELPVPDSRSRASILKALSGLSPNAEERLLENAASRTHGFVGADLAMLIRVASKEARQRIKVSGSGRSGNVENPTFSISQIEDQDIDFALLKVKPTAIREVFVEIQQTRWNDIGGQEEVKEILRQALIWPSKYGEDFKAQGIVPDKGLLLYGPPGCSKTMTARAAATESGYNFIAVKGAELLNMYVGESERKIREVFCLARSVSPSILFFDEIDAIGTARSDGHQSGLNIVTTLLNELDGIVGLTDVFVLAATNRPDAIDSALTRAGRLDKMLYVGPPDLEARRYILSKQVKKMRVNNDLDIDILAQDTDGFSGAELMNICKEAALAAIKELELERKEGAHMSSVVGRKHFDKALNGVHKVITPQMLAFFDEFRFEKNS